MSRSTQAEQMKELVGSFHRSGQSRKEFAMAHGLTESKLQYWIKKLSLEPVDREEALASFIPLKAPTDGTVYIFINRAKLLHWQGGGFVLYYKRLERGSFELPAYDGAVSGLSLDYAHLVLLVDGFRSERFLHDMDVSQWPLFGAEGTAQLEDPLVETITYTRP